MEEVSFKSQIMRSLANFIFRHTIAVLVVSVSLAIISVVLSFRIQLKTNIKDLLPNNPNSKAFNEIIDRFQSASSLFLLLEGDEKHTIPFSRMIVQKIQQNKKLMSYIKYIQLEQDKAFFQKYGLLLSKNNQTENSIEMFRKVQLLPFLTAYNDNMEKTYTGKYRQESIDSKKKEMQLDIGLSNVEQFMEILIDYIKHPDSVSIRERAMRMADLMTVGETLSMSRDRKILLIFIQPAVSMNEIDKATELVNQLDQFVKSHLKMSHKPMKAMIGGMLAIQKDEMQFLIRDMQFPAAVALILIIILFLISFTRPRSAFFIVLSLIIGICWAMGYIAVVYGELNRFTSMMSVILVGLGVDFGIHLMTQYTEDRGQGIDKKSALENAFVKTGWGIILGGITTSIAFATLALSETHAMREFGLFTGIGVLLCLVSMMTFLPALTIILDRKPAQFKIPKYYMNYNFLLWSANLVRKYHWTIIILCILITAIMTYFSLQNTFEYDMLEIEPLKAESIIATKKILKHFEMSPDYIMISLKDDTDKDVESLKYNTKLSALDKARRIALFVEPKTDIIAFVESLADYIPNQNRQEVNLQLLQRLRNQSDRTVGGTLNLKNYQDLLNQIKRLENNILELADLTVPTFGEDSRIVKRRNQMIHRVSQNNKSGIHGKELFKSLIHLINLNKEQSIDRLNQLSTLFAGEMNKRVNLFSSPNKRLTIDSLPKSIRNRYLSIDMTHQLCTIYINKNIWDQKVLESTRGLFKNLKFRHLPPEKSDILVQKIIPNKNNINDIPVNKVQKQDSKGTKSPIPLSRDKTKSTSSFDEDFKVDIEKIQKMDKQLDKMKGQSAKELQEDPQEINRFTGSPIITLELIEMLGREGKRAMIIALIAIFLLLLIYTRSLKYSLITTLPLIFGSLWMVGIMYLYGLKFDVFNVMALPIILGIGIDDGIHLIHRFQIEGDKNPEVVIQYTGRGIFLTTMTSVFAFGTIGVLGEYKGFAGFGMVLSFGLITCFIVSIFLLPSLVYVLAKKNINLRRKL